MSDTLSTGIAPGFGGFAATPAGQLQYWNRQHNPYAFLQQQPDIVGDTAPAAAQELARGGLAGMKHGGRVLCLDEGGDATDGGFDSGGFGPGTADAGFGGPGNATDPGAPGSQTSTDAFDAPGLEIGEGQLGFNNENVSLGQLGLAGAKGLAGGLLGSVGMPGLGTVANAAYGKAAGPDNFGLGQMGPGAQMGSNVGAMVGGIGGPVGAALGAMAGAMMGAHGEMGSGTPGGTGSTAGTAGTATSTGPASNDADGFGVNMGMDAPSPGSGVGLGNPGGSAQTTPNVADATDLTGLIKRIRDALTASTNTPAMASGGTVRGGAPNHAFHAGSGLVHGTSDGRADALHMQVPRGGYVVPADVVSGLGQGNTMAGAKKLTGLIPQQAPAMASGGAVPVRLSAGEFYVHPSHVAALGGGNLKHGSDKLDEMVGHVRQASQRQVASMPPPR
jgi:hypothetical protein